MSDNGNSHALVVGAGIAGLAAAAAIAPFFATVTVFEKDELPGEARHRRGVGHGLQLHILLKGGELALEELLPGTREALIAAGAAEIKCAEDVTIWERSFRHPMRDIGYSQLGMSRRAYEHVLRRQVQAIANVQIRDRISVEALLIENDRLAGLEFSDASATQAVRGDLVVVATGRSGQLARWLAEAGLPAIPTTELGIEVNYATGRFAKPDRFKGEHRFIACFPNPPEVGLGLLVPVENDEWLIAMGGRFDTRAPVEPDALLRYAEALPIPDIAERLRDAPMVEPVRAYRVPSASWWHFDRYEALPERLVPIGDSITSFNPTFGQGMSVAAKHAVVLRRALAARRSSGKALDGLAADYLPDAMEASAQAWSVASAVDLEYSQTIGTRPPDYDKSLAWMEAMRRAVLRHPEVHKLRFEIGNMIRPGTASREGPLAALIAAELPRPA